MKSLKRPDILGSNESYVSTCRSGIGLVLDQLLQNNKIALLPAFTCESVLDPFLKRGYELHPYRINKDLSVNADTFLEDIHRFNPSVVLIHPYFGFDTTLSIQPVINELRANGVIFIEDMTQSMFSGFKPLKANYYVGSLRKWMPIPDGAFTTAINRNHEEDTELVEAKMKALTEKGDWLLYDNGDKATFRQDFATAEQILDSRTKAYSMSSVAREIYDRTDRQAMKKSRRDNYLFLQYYLTSDQKLKTSLQPILYLGQDGVCPFHYPVYVNEGRRELQQYLASRDIYATVIWGCPDLFKNDIDETARYIYDHILCFHVDQRYNEHDMDRIINELKEYYK